MVSADGPSDACCQGLAGSVPVGPSVRASWSMSRLKTQGDGTLTAIIVDPRGRKPADSLTRHRVVPRPWRVSALMGCYHRLPGATSTRPTPGRSARHHIRNQTGSTPSPMRTADEALPTSRLRRSSKAAPTTRCFADERMGRPGD